jgi:hypothetical protein
MKPALTHPQHGGFRAFNQVLSSMLSRDPSARPSLDQLARHPLLRRHEARLQAQLRSLAALAMPSESPDVPRAERPSFASDAAAASAGGAHTSSSPAPTDRARGRASPASEAGSAAVTAPSPGDAAD